MDCAHGLWEFCQDDLPRRILKCGLWVWILALFFHREDIVSQPEFPFVKNGENNTTFPGGSAGKESICSVGDMGLIPGLERSPGERKGYPLHYSGLENSMDWIVHEVTRSLTWLSDFHILQGVGHICLIDSVNLEDNHLSSCYHLWEACNQVCGSCLIDVYHLWGKFLLLIQMGPLAHKQ